ncbi:MAG: alpha/beta hydrolase [Oscillospiraceae bacterium]|nr:alpha/beta hydrolase [Oscillospiraceae bacterium]
MVYKFDYYFPAASQARRIHLYLPDDYDFCGERYPTLYMFDGHNLFFDFDATYGKSLGLKQFLDHWGKKLIVVGIECSNDDVQRLHEYCPYHIYSRIYGEVWGRGDDTLRWIVEDLKPYIDRTYRTYPFRESTAIAGYSNGGMTALYSVLRYNRFFSKAAVISPSLLPAMESFDKEIRDDSLSPDTKVFFSWGTAEDTPERVQNIADSICYLEAKLMEKQVQTYLYCQQGGVHNEASWEIQVPTWMQFLWL